MSTPDGPAGGPPPAAGRAGAQRGGGDAGAASRDGDPAGGLVIRRATAADLPTVAAIVEDARAWLAERGIGMWTLPFDEAWLRPRIAAGEVWLAEIDGAAVATLRLLGRDPEVWGEDDGHAAYVHTLAVRRDRAGEGIGRRLLAWAAGQARANGRRFLRLDCVARNPALLAYYDAAGFARVGTARAGGSDLVLFERGLDGPPP